MLNLVLDFNSEKIIIIIIIIIILFIPQKVLQIF